MCALPRPTPHPELADLPTHTHAPAHQVVRMNNQPVLTPQLEAEIRADERRHTADAIAHQLAVKVCSATCEHPSCTTYRFAARTARLAGEQPVFIPTPRKPE